MDIQPKKIKKENLTLFALLIIVEKSYESWGNRLVRCER